MSSPYSHTESDIIRTCGYITDDKYIASIFGVSIHKVKRLREKASQAKPADPKESTGHISVSKSELEHRSMMEKGSRKLLEALHSFLLEREQRIRRLGK